ncbi:MAG: tetratricopeptide repeat protein [Desulfobulbus sp.]|nr:tetratricopeptide repeat protein [Desulfobulbus sp.]
MENIKAKWWVVTLFLLIGSVIYSNTFNVPFHFDDENNIKSPALRIESFNLENVSRVFSSGTLTTRPISNFTFALNYYFGGYRVQGYHLVNLLVHVGAGVALYFLFLVTLNLDVNKQKYRNTSLISLLAALLWLVHPLGTQSVTYIVQRMNSLSALFYILSMFCYAQGRIRKISAGDMQSATKGWAWFTACGCAGFLAVGSKEIAATLPFFIFLYEWFFFQDGQWNWLGKKLFWLVGIFLLFLTIAIFYTDGHLIDRIFGNNCSGRDFTTIERVLTQFRVVIYYITLVFYPAPSRLALDYDFPVSTSLLLPLTTLYSLVGILALLVFALILFRRERLLSFCILWFFGNLVIESSVICLEIIFEHRTYLPSMFLILFVVALVCRFSRGRMISIVSLVLVIGLFAYWAHERNKVWRTARALWADSVCKYPDKARTHVNLGRTFVEEENWPSAEQELRKGLLLDPGAEIGHNNLAALLLRQGRVGEAELHYQEAVRIKPDYVLARVGFGGILRDRGLYLGAADQFRKAFNAVPEDVVVNKNLGNALLRAGKPMEALPYLRTAAAGASKDMEILLDIGEALTRLDKSGEAIETYRKILRQDRSQGSAHYQLAILLKEKGQIQEALSHYREADRLLRYPTDLKYDYANLLFRSGHLAEADNEYLQFLAVAPTLAMAHNNRGLVLVNQGKLEEAVREFQAALKIEPSFVLAANNLRLATEQLQQAAQSGAPKEPSTP